MSMSIEAVGSLILAESTAILSFFWAVFAFEGLTQDQEDTES